ncbi:hypothetical protein QU487_10070 [Crenobacter sp. SG2305]|uniref:hypothetical protein n=1 Tax=Crenobacter oryzisoli TaxID=3056844 RepID=UPI0025AA3CE8|nr:hypothetical protein [Crenobacter sp. SG2305]MDN0083095.1 hypothetical protein [Crenobacter sp. SG2305]
MNDSDALPRRREWHLTGDDPAAWPLWVLAAVALGIWQAGARWPLGVPGYQGLVSMAILTVMLRRRDGRLSGTVLVTGGLLFAGLLGAPLGLNKVFAYLGMALLLDLVATRARRGWHWVLLAAAAFALRPVLRWWLLPYTGGQWGAEPLWRVVYWHALFGLAGGTLGVLLLRRPRR